MGKYKYILLVIIIVVGIGTTYAYKSLSLEDAGKIQSKTDALFRENNNEQVSGAVGNDQVTEKYLIEETIGNEDVYNKNTIKFMRSDNQNGVITDVTFTNPIEFKDIQKNNFVFNVVLSTHSYNISEKELNKKLIVKINDINIENGDIIKWLPDGIPEGHHVSGNILIPKIIDDKDLSNVEVKSIEIFMNDVAGANQRSFKWIEQELK